MTSRLETFFKQKLKAFTQVVKLLEPFKFICRAALDEFFFKIMKLLQNFCIRLGLSEYNFVYKESQERVGQGIFLFYVLSGIIRIDDNDLPINTVLSNLILEKVHNQIYENKQHL